MLKDNLKLRVSDYQYWMNLASRLGVDSYRYRQLSGSGIPSLETLSRYFDSTLFGLLCELHSKDIDKDQNFAVLDISRGLSQQGLYSRQGSPVGDAAYQELIDWISTDCSESVDGSSSSARHARYPEFVVALRNIRLAAILRDVQLTDQDMCMNLYEYSGKQLNSACPIENPVAFLFNPASDLFLNPHIQAHVSRVTGEYNHHVKWLHAHKASKRLIMGLGVKYALDPRFVFRVFSLGSVKAEEVSFCDVHYEVTAKAAGDACSSIDSVSTSASSSFHYTPVSPNFMTASSIDRPMWFFMVVPILRLSAYSRSTLRKYRAWRERMKGYQVSLETPPSVEIIIEHCNLAMFLSGIAAENTAISFSSNWVELMQFSTGPKTAERTSVMNNWCCRRRANLSTNGSSTKAPINQTAKGNNHSATSSKPSDRVSDAGQLSMFNEALSSIRISNSDLRSGDAHTFVLKVLCDITEEYQLVREAYIACSQILNHSIDEDDDRVNPKEIRKLQEFVTQLSKLVQVVRPVADMIDTDCFLRQWNSKDRLSLLDIRSNLAVFLGGVSYRKRYAELILKREREASLAFWKLIWVTSWLALVYPFLIFLCGMIIQFMGQLSIPEIWWER